MPNKLKDIGTKFFVLFGILSSIIWLHEFVHVIQFSASGYNITEFCAAGSRDGKIGWVEAEGNSVNADLSGEMEWIEAEAWLFSGVLVFVVLLLMYFDNNKSK